MLAHAKALRLGLVGGLASLIGLIGCSGPNPGAEESSAASKAAAPRAEIAIASEASHTHDPAGPAETARRASSQREVPKHAELPGDAPNHGQRPHYVTAKGEGPFTISERAYRLAERRGFVRAIVHIRSRTRSDGELQPPKPVHDPGQEPPGDLEVAQDRFLSFLHDREELTPTRYTSIPYLALTLTFPEIRELAAANRVGGDFELPSGERIDFSISASPRFKRAALASGANALAQIENPFDAVLDHLQARIRGASGAGFTVVVIDDGIDPASQFIGGRVVGGHHLIDGVPAFAIADAPALDPEAGKPDKLGAWSISHGTGVASVIHAVAPEADLVSLRVDENGAFDGANLLTALVEVEQYWSKALANPVAAICLSLSEDTLEDDSTCHVPPEAEAFLDILTKLAEADFPIPVIVAAGNDGLVTTLGFPSCVSTVISVGASTDPSIDGVVDYSERASYSNWSSDLGLVAPGGGFAYDTSNGPYSIGPGTSYAAPFVAGAFALMRERSPASTSAEIFAALQARGMSVADAAAVTGAAAATVAGTPSLASRPQIQVFTALEALSTRPR